MLKLVAATLLLISHFSAQADELKRLENKGDAAFKAAAFSEAYDYWFVGASQGNGEQQESVAKLLLGPNRHALKRSQRERAPGIRFLYRAAVGGRRTAMLALSDAIRDGSFGALRRPTAAECWWQAANGKRDVASCVGLTEFRDRRFRATCAELVLFDGPKDPTARDGARLAHLCLANKTPTLLVPGTPPSAEELQRVREYGKQGIEWIITGDVLREDFERFRNAFNSTMAAAIESREGHGYLDRLGRQIDGKIKQRRR